MAESFISMVINQLASSLTGDKTGEYWPVHDAPWIFYWMLLDFLLDVPGFSTGYNLDFPLDVQDALCVANS